MRPKPQTTEQQLQKELENLKLGHHQESAVYFIKPVNLLATGLSEPEDIADWIRLELDNNDLYNGYAINSRREAIQYLSEWNGSMYNLDAALIYALDFGYDLQTVERMGSELLANIAANEQARQEDTDAIEGAAHRLALIIKAGTRITIEDL